MVRGKAEVMLHLHTDWNGWDTRILLTGCHELCSTNWDKLSIGLLMDPFKELAQTDKTEARYWLYIFITSQALVWKYRICRAEQWLLYAQNWHRKNFTSVHNPESVHCTPCSDNIPRTSVLFFPHDHSPWGSVNSLPPHLTCMSRPPK